VPDNIEKYLYEIFTLNSIRNIKLLTALIKILRTFNQANINIIPLKGPLLSDTIHGHIGIRSSSDLDLLIQKKDYPYVRQELAKIGYLPLKVSYSEEFIMDFLRHRPFTKGNVCSPLNPLVEIHWNFYPQQPQEFDMRQVWKTAVPTKTENTPFLSLSPSYILIHLAISLRIHGYLNFRHFSDLDALLTNFKDKIDWEYVIKQAVINKQRIALFYALYFSRELLETDIPSNILKRIRPSWLQKKLVSILVNQQKIAFPEKKENAILYSDLVNLLTIDSLNDAFRILYRILFSHPEDMAERYKKSSFPETSRLSFLLRPFYLIWSVIKSLFVLLKK